MPFKDLPAQNLGEQVSGVCFRRDVSHAHDPCSAQLPHLVELALDVTRVLGRRVAVAEVVSTLVVRLDLNGPVELVPNEATRHAGNDPPKHTNT